MRYIQGRSAVRGILGPQGNERGLHLFIHVISDIKPMNLTSRSAEPTRFIRPQVPKLPCLKLPSFLNSCSFFRFG